MMVIECLLVLTVLMMMVIECLLAITVLMVIIDSLLSLC